jgi:hypothetical protein
VYANTAPTVFSDDDNDYISSTNADPAAAAAVATTTTISTTSTEYISSDDGGWDMTAIYALVAGTAGTTTTLLDGIPLAGTAPHGSPNQYAFGAQSLLAQAGVPIAEIVVTPYSGSACGYSEAHLCTCMCIPADSHPQHRYRRLFEC